MTPERPPESKRIGVDDQHGGRHRGTGSDAPIPRPVLGIDIRTLPIGPEEAFVLSRVDGQTTTREISHATSLGEAQVAQCLARLESLAAITFDARTSGPTHPSHTAAAPNSSPRPDAPQRSEPAASTPSEPVLVPLYDISELDAPADLELENKRLILELYYRLDKRDYYQLLGVPNNADRRAVKAAYYEKVRTFHPDRHFGKNLGTFGPKLEQCFARLTIAHDTLANATKREEYDAYLAAQLKAVELERALSQTITFDDLDMLEQRLNTLVRLEPTANIDSAAETHGSPDVETSRSSYPGNNANPPPSERRPSCQVPKMSDEDRKRLLARKLRASTASLRAPQRVADFNSPSSQSPPSRKDIADQLLRHHGSSSRDDHIRQLESLLAKADAAMKANDPVGASNALRMAQGLAPKDPAIVLRLEQSMTMATESLSETYRRQAEYEEKSGRLEAAARSYERAARGRPTAELWEAAARCQLDSGGDVRKAAEFARASIALDSERATSHLVLGRVFLSAGMRSSAVAELERARRLDPNNDTVGNLIKRIANGSV